MFSVSLTFKCKRFHGITNTDTITRVYQNSNGSFKRSSKNVTPKCNWRHKFVPLIDGKSSDGLLKGGGHKSSAFQTNFSVTSRVFAVTAIQSFDICSVAFSLKSDGTLSNPKMIVLLIEAHFSSSKINHKWL